MPRLISIHLHVVPGLTNTSYSTTKVKQLIHNPPLRIIQTARGLFNRVGTKIRLTLRNGSFLHAGAHL